MLKNGQNVTQNPELIINPNFGQNMDSRRIFVQNFVH